VIVAAVMVKRLRVGDGRDSNAQGAAQDHLGMPRVAGFGGAPPS